MYSPLAQSRLPSADTSAVATIFAHRSVRLAFQRGEEQAQLPLAEGPADAHELA